MAIPFTCPECDRDIKVKDELAGRKVKCPKCGAGVRVPELDADAEEAPQRPAKKARVVETDDEQEDAEERSAKKKSRRDEEDDDRPRKKSKKGKKEPKKSNTGLIIRVAVGVGVLAILLVALGIKLMSGGSKTNEPTQAKGGAPQGAPVIEQSSAGAPAVDKEVMTDLLLIGLNYFAVIDQERRPPKGPEDMKRWLDNRSFARLTSGQYVIIWGVRPYDLGPKMETTVLGYDKDVATRGGPVIFANGRPRSVTAAEFQKLAKAEPKQEKVVAKVAPKRTVEDSRRHMEWLRFSFTSFLRDNGKPPASLDQFLTVVGTIGTGIELKEGRIIFHYGVGPNELNANDIIAYEANPGANGNRVVLKVDGKIEELGAEAFQRAKMAKK